MYLVHTIGGGVKVERIGFQPLHTTNLAALWGSSTPVVIHDTQADTRYPEFSSNVTAAGFRSGCLLPLTTAVRPVGILAVVSRETGAYDAADLAFLQRVASQVAVAIDNVRHHEQALAYQRQLEAERDHWRTLLEVNNAVVANLDLKALLAAITPNIRRIVPHDSINLALLDAASGRVSLHAMNPPLPPELTDLVMSVDPENTPFARAITLRKPSLVAP
jgi:formate hydrogenlyase transcriptional activator